LSLLADLVYNLYKGTALDGQHYLAFLRQSLQCFRQTCLSTK
jgi:hypothetical protein